MYEEPSQFDIGFLVGLLVGEGSFSGDGKQPQVVLRMHTDHEAVFQWLVDHFPGGRLYGPYNHDGRHYYQWIARGPYLRDVLVPLLARYLRPEHSARCYARFQRMLTDYPKFLFRTAADESAVLAAGDRYLNTPRPAREE